jgi:hypothetical protein
MSLAAQGGLRLVTGGGSSPSRAGRVTRWLPLLLAALAIAVAAYVSDLSAARERAVRALPEQQRLGLLSRTVDELRRSCGEGRAEALADHCRELASFAAGFEECQGDCKALVRRALEPVPTR